MTHDELNLHRRSSERLRYAVDVARKSVTDAYKKFSLGRKPYHQLFSDVCQDINAQLDTLELLIKPLLTSAPKYDFENVEANGLRSLLGVVDCALKELIGHVKYCNEKHDSFFFNGTSAANKLSSFCSLLSKLGKLLDIATLMDQHMDGDVLFLELSDPVGSACMDELEHIPRDCFYGELVGFHYTASIQRTMKAICVALTSYGLGYYSDVPAVFGQPSYGKSLFWRSSTSLIGGAKYWFNEEERSHKFVELTDSCATIEFTKSFWNLIETGIMAEVPKLVTRNVDVSIEIFINGEPLYVRNKADEMILIHPPVGKHGFAGVTVGFLSSQLREGQFSPQNVPNIVPPVRVPKCSRLLVHFHGGGFVAGSHIYHEAYLRGWSIELDTVIVSINYSLAPENPFPKGLDDCIFAYAWCLENLHSLGCTGKSIIFMGDSAGGNLAISTAMRANSYGLRGPDAIMAAYPVTYVKYAGSFSRLLSSMDILLPSGILQCCVRAYAGVPVDDNTMFCQWLRTAENKPAVQEPSAQSIAVHNSKYISDIAMSTDDAVGENIPEKAASRYILTDVVNPTFMEDSDSETSNNGIVDSADIDTIMINPVVFDSTLPCDTQKMLDSEGPKGNEANGSKNSKNGSENGENVPENSADIENSRQSAELTSNLSDVLENVNTENSKINPEDWNAEEIDRENDSDPDCPEDDVSAECRGEINGDRDSDDLEKMLYDDSDTQFRATKLVLTPNKAERETPTPPPLKSTPTTPLSNVYMEPNPLGKMAIVVEDQTRFNYPEPAYVINPGEIADRKNVTLLQKYFDDPFLSPFLADLETLAQLPPIHIVAAELDPLLDDAVAFCRKVKSAGGDIKFEVVPGMTHGFLNLVLNSSTCATAAKRCLKILDGQFKSAENC